MKIPQLLLPGLVVAYLAGCTDTSTNKTAILDKEKVIVIPSIKDSGSVHNKLRQSLPYSYQLGNDYGQILPDSIKAQLTGEYFLEIQADTTKLHIKGDSCWLEYISAGRVRAKKKDGTFMNMPTEAAETTDTVVSR